MKMVCFFTNIVGSVLQIGQFYPPKPFLLDMCFLFCFLTGRVFMWDRDRGAEWQCGVGCGRS